MGQLGDFDDNRPRAVRCVHPPVTLIEKLDALMRRLPRDDAAPATFVRHFEDAVRALADEMLAQKQIAALPSAKHAAFSPTENDRWRAVQKAHDAIGPMFWGPRLSLVDSCVEIRGRLDAEVGP